jgi:hypothetical protein
MVNSYQQIVFDVGVDGDPLEAVDKVGDDVGGHARKVIL